jgi:hypothetical protein
MAWVIDMIYYDYKSEEWRDKEDTNFLVKMTTEDYILTWGSDVRRNINHRDLGRAFDSQDEFYEWYKDIETLEGYAKVLHLPAGGISAISDRLNEMKALSDGWKDGEGIAPSKEGIEWLSESFRLYYPDDLTKPCLYATLDGGIRAEWSCRGFETSMHVDLNRRIGYFAEMGAYERTLHLDKPSDWKLLAKRIKDNCD